MDILAQLGVALGLASLAGVNLYLTVLVTGLAVRFHWIELAASYQSLEVLGHPLVLGVAGLLFLMQFCADKIPWVDSLWDSVHTVIRPVGGTLLALEALGTMPGYVKVAAALIAGGAALTTHSAKAGTRLLINHSPEPVTNVAMSLTEEAAVTGGVMLTLLKPVVALAVFGGLLTVIWLLFPRIWRLISTTMWLIWHKLKLPGRREMVPAPVPLKDELNDELKDLLRIRAGLVPEDVAWTVRCLSGKARGVRGFGANLNGVLVAPTRPDCLHFATIKGLRSRLFKIPLEETQVEVDSRFLSENVTLTGKGTRAVFRFPRGQGALAETVAQKIRELMAKPVEPLGSQVSEPVAESPAPETLEPFPTGDDPAPLPADAPAPAPTPVADGSDGPGAQVTPLPSIH